MFSKNLVPQLFIECSAKAKTGIVQAFEELVQKILDSPQLAQSEGAGLNIASGGNASSSSCGC